MTNIRIVENNASSQRFIEYARNLPFTKIEEEPKSQKMTFEEAVAECNGISVDDFFDKLDERIKKHFKHA